jgi:hypothetical protein
MRAGAGCVPRVIPQEARAMNEIPKEIEERIIRWQKDISPVRDFYRRHRVSRFSNYRLSRSRKLPAFAPV